MAHLELRHLAPDPATSARIGPAWMAWSADDNREAVALCEALLGDGGLSPRARDLARLVQARALRDDKETPEARRILDELARRGGPVGAAALRSRALLLYRAGAVEAGDARLLRAWRTGGAARDPVETELIVELIRRHRPGAVPTEAGLRLSRCLARRWPAISAGRDRRLQARVLSASTDLAFSHGGSPAAWRRVDGWLRLGRWHPDAEGALLFASEMLSNRESTASARRVLSRWLEALPARASEPRRLVLAQRALVRAIAGDIASSHRDLRRLQRFRRSWHSELLRDLTRLYVALTYLEVGPVEHGEALLEALARQEGRAPWIRTLVLRTQVLAGFRRDHGGQLERTRQLVELADPRDLVNVGEAWRLRTVALAMDGQLDAAEAALAKARGAYAAVGGRRGLLLCEVTETMLVDAGHAPARERAPVLADAVQSALEGRQDAALEGFLRQACLNLLHHLPEEREARLMEAWEASVTRQPDAHILPDEWGLLLRTCEDEELDPFVADLVDVLELWLDRDLGAMVTLTLDGALPVLLDRGRPDLVAPLGLVGVHLLLDQRATRLRPLARSEHGVLWSDITRCLQTALLDLDEGAEALQQAALGASVRTAELRALQRLPRRRRQRALGHLSGLLRQDLATDGARRGDEVEDGAALEALDGSLRTTVKAQDGATSSAAGDRPAADWLAAVTASLAPGELVLQAALGRDELVIHGLSAEGLLGVQRLEEVEGELDALVRRLARGRSRGRLYEVELALEGLSGLLGRPLATLMGTARVVHWLPTGALTACPLAALSDPSGRRGALLGDGRLVVRPLSLQALLERGEAPVARGRRLSLVDPHGDLPHTREEGAVLAARLPDLELRQGPAATEAALTRAEGRLGLLHLATHGRLAPDWPLLSRVHLAAEAEEDGLLTALEVLLRREAPAIALLHGCHTAGAVHLGAEESVELAHTWLAAGARAVVGCAGPLPDAVGLPFTEGLAAALAEGEPVGRAFEAGLVQVRARFGERARWAGLRLYGDHRLRLSAAEARELGPGGG